jgi:hypothetical protein
LDFNIKKTDSSKVVRKKILVNFIIWFIKIYIWLGKIGMGWEKCKRSRNTNETNGHN